MIQAMISAGRAPPRAVRSIDNAEDKAVSLDWKSGPLAEGLACYRSGQFFLAHEHWESVWLQLQEPEKTFLQALIQTAAAFHHLQAGNRAGTISLLRRALSRLEPRPTSFGGIAVTPLCTQIHVWLRELESSTHPAARAFPEISPIDPPTASSSGC